MEDETRELSPEEQPEELSFDVSLRPRSLDQFVGQQKLKDHLNVFMTAAKQRKEPIEHTLLYGNPGLGKTTLAHIISHEMGANIRTTSGPALERVGDLAAILTNLEEGQHAARNEREPEHPRREGRWVGSLGLQHRDAH